MTASAAHRSGSCRFREDADPARIAQLVGSTRAEEIVAALEARGLRVGRGFRPVLLGDGRMPARLPVFVRVGNKYNRLEPDFLVVYKGLTFVVEVAIPHLGVDAESVLTFDKKA